MKTNIELSVIVPAFNEEGNIQSAINSVEKAIKPLVKKYEIIVVNDGSSDNTAANTKKLMQHNSHIKLISRTKNLGLGQTFLEGVSHATLEYVTAFHGDNDASSSFLASAISNIGNADVITIYPTNVTGRSFFRVLISNMFVGLMNLIFGMKLKYFNGTFICKTNIVKRLQLTSKGFAIYAEAKVRLHKLGYSFKEIPFECIGRKTGKSTAVSVNNFKYTVMTIFDLMRDMYFHI